MISGDDIRALCACKATGGGTFASAVEVTLYSYGLTRPKAVGESRAWVVTDMGEELIARLAAKQGVSVAEFVAAGGVRERSLILTPGDA